MRTVVKNANIVLRDRVIWGAVCINGGRVERICSGGCEALEAGAAVLDAQRGFLMAGFIDLHTHGAGGHDFMDGTEDCFSAAAACHLRHGTTAFLPTLLSGPFDEFYAALEGYRQTKAAGKGANMLGLHLEGPYFSVHQKGAQDAAYIHAPDEEEYMHFLDCAQGDVLRWSAAPELPGGMAFGRALRQRGILAAIAHSDAEYETVQEAFWNGYTHITHLYSGMSTIVRRDGYRIPGVLESAFIIPDMTVELIADGCHLPPALLRMTVQCKGVDKVCLVTDSMRAAGMEPGESILGSLGHGQRVLVDKEVARMPDGKAFAGSVATADRLLRVMHFQAGIGLPECSRMMSATPAALLGIEGRKGSLEVGKDADMVLLDSALHVCRTFLCGEMVYGDKFLVAEQQK